MTGNIYKSWHLDRVRLEPIKKRYQKIAISENSVHAGFASINIQLGILTSRCTVSFTLKSENQTNNLSNIVGPWLSLLGVSGGLAYNPNPYDVLKQSRDQ